MNPACEAEQGACPCPCLETLCADREAAQAPLDAKIAISFFFPAPHIGTAFYIAVHPFRPK